MKKYIFQIKLKDIPSPLTLISGTNSFDKESIKSEIEWSRLIGIVEDNKDGKRKL